MFVVVTVVVVVVVVVCCGGPQASCGQQFLVAPPANSQLPNLGPGVP